MLSDLILDLGKCPNLKTYTFTFRRFPVGALPKVQNWIGHLSKKILYDYNSEVFLERFGLYLTKSKKWISHCIFKSCTARLRVFFKARKLILFHKISCIFLLISHGGPQSLDFVITTYSYSLVLCFINKKKIIIIRV